MVVMNRHTALLPAANGEQSREWFARASKSQTPSDSRKSCRVAGAVYPKRYFDAMPPGFVARSLSLESGGFVFSETNKNHKLTEEDHKRLGKARLAAWRAVHKCSFFRWTPVPKRVLLHESGLKTRALERAVNDLVNLGVVERSLRTKKYKNGNSQDAYKRRAFFRSKVVPGRYVPVENWAMFLETVQPKGRPKKKKDDAYRASKNKKDDALKTIGTIYSRSLDTYVSKDTPQSGEVLASPRRGEVKTSLGTVMRGNANLNTEPIPAEFLATIPPVDSAEKVSTCHQVFHASTPPSVRVEGLLAAYNTAVRECYGIKPRPWGPKQSLPTDRVPNTRADHDADTNAARWVMKLKSYDRLVAGAEIMVEEEIAPLAWALWWMPKLKHRWPDGPPPPAMLFSATTLSKRYGWFRKTNQSGGLEYKTTKAHLEQMFRRREAELRFRGADDDDVLYRGFPQWYAEMRAEEVRTGFADPIACWPRIRR